MSVVAFAEARPITIALLANGLFEVDPRTLFVQYQLDVPLLTGGYQGPRPGFSRS